MWLVKFKQIKFEKPFSIAIIEVEFYNEERKGKDSFIEPFPFNIDSDVQELLNKIFSRLQEINEFNNKLKIIKEALEDFVTPKAKELGIDFKKPQPK